MEDKDFLQAIGMKIKLLRTYKGYSQDDVVDKLDIDKSYYSKVERGLTNPTLLYLKRLSEIFETPLVELVNPNINL